MAGECGPNIQDIHLPKDTFSVMKQLVPSNLQDSSLRTMVFSASSEPFTKPAEKNVKAVSLY